MENSEWSGKIPQNFKFTSLLGGRGRFGGKGALCILDYTNP